MHRRPKLMQGIPSSLPPGSVCMITGEIVRYAQSMQALQALIAPAGSILSWHMGMLVARSINDAFATVMEKPELQWAWIMGDDHTYSPDILMSLIKRDKEVIVPLCLNRVPPMDPTIVQVDPEHNTRGLKPLEDLPTSGLYKLGPNESCGDAGMLIRRSVLEKSGPKWYERMKSGAHQAEDDEFVAKLKMLGFDIYVDLDDRIGHIGAVNFVPEIVDGKWVVRSIGAGYRRIADLKVGKREGPAPIRPPLTERILVGEISGNGKAPEHSEVDQSNASH